MSNMEEDHHNFENRVESEAKRRKTRKGTRSCWECKRRKMKCIFARSPTEADAICIGCQRRATKCVSQEFELVQEEEDSVPLDRNRDDRVARVEALVEQLIRKVGSHGVETPMTSDDRGNPTPHYHGIPTPAFIDSDSSRFLPVYKPPDNHERTYEKLSQSLHKSLPLRGDIEKICRTRGNRSFLSYEMFTTPYSVLKQDGLKLPETLLEIPGSDSHPVLIARYMLHIATFLQHLPPDLLDGVDGLSESPRTMMKRLAEIAIGLVTTNDELLSSIEGLECVMIESLYQSDGGNLRRSWIAIRRAMVIAQLMNLHRGGNQAHYKVLDVRTRAYPQFMWFRIVFHDRHLCLLLGLTQGSLDRSFAADAMLRTDTHMGCLERIHCDIASRILERNESDLSSHDFTLTQDLDMELQKAARSLPSKWWLTPNLASFTDDSQALFWDMGRLFNQLFYYNLLNQLHLPYMLRSSPERKYEYSRMTCVNASREVLSRFIMFRSFNRNVFCCRTVDFFALMSAITLLLAHLDSHRFSQADNLLAHQCLSDRAMIEQAQENMEEISRLNSDALSTQSADLLRRLLAIESETADGLSMESVSVQTHESESMQPGEDKNGVVLVQIPYFGIVKIAHQGIISKEVANQQPPASNGRAQAPVIGMSSTGSLEAVMRPLGFELLDKDYLPGSMAEADYDSVDGINHLATQLAPQFPDANPYSLLQQYAYPPLSAGVDDWAFQGVDTAFFGSLMKGTGYDENNSGTWAREDERMDNGNLFRGL